MSIGWCEDIKKELGACGQNVFIGHNVIFLRPKEVFLGDNVRIDPFSLIACGLVAEGNNQLQSYTLMNGRKQVHLAKWAGLSYRITLLTGSENFTGEFGAANDFFNKGQNPSLEEDIIFNKYSNALAHSIIMPGSIIPEGTVIAANSLVTNKDKLDPYWIYGMRQAINSPSLKLQKIKIRNEENIKRFTKEWDLQNPK